MEKTTSGEILQSMFQFPAKIAFEDAAKTRKKKKKTPQKNDSNEASQTRSSSWKPGREPSQPLPLQDRHWWSNHQM
jgi:hypothetical protein